MPEGLIDIVSHQKSPHFERVCSLSPSFSSVLLIKINRKCNIPLSVNHCNLEFLAGKTINAYILDLNKLLKFSRRSFMLYKKKKKIYSPRPHLFIWQCLFFINVQFIFYRKIKEDSTTLQAPTDLPSVRTLKGEVNWLLGYMWIMSL